MELLQNRKVLMIKNSYTRNTDVCAEQYRYETELYLLSMLYHAYKIVIDRGVGAYGHGKYVPYVLNTTGNNILTMLMTTVQLTDAAINKSQIVIHTTTINTYISISRVFKNISDPTHAHGLIDHGKDRKRASKHKQTDREYHFKDKK